MELAGSVKGSFLPETRKVKHAERTCDSGSDERNDLAHCFSSFMVLINGRRINSASYKVLARGALYGKR